MIVGTAGHIDHGKTALVGALTGVDTDRLPEEKQRGISIELGYAAMSRGPGLDPVAFVDVPGHEKLIRTMLAGACGVDFVLLLLAADDGVMPQTLEHATILSLLGLRRGALVVTKIDRVDAATVLQRCDEGRALLQRLGLEDYAVLPVSAVRGDGLDALRAHLLSQADQSERPPSAESGFRMGLDRVFTLDGVGTVVAGSVQAGTLQPGDSVCLARSPQQTYRVRSVHSHGHPLTQAVAGQRAAVGLAGLARDRVERGDCLCHADIALASQRIDTWLRVPPGQDRALRSGMKVMVHANAQDTPGVLTLLGVSRLEAGEVGLAQLVLQRPLHVWAHDAVVLRDAAATRTLAGGLVLDAEAPARYRQSPERLRYLQSQIHADSLRRLQEGVAALAHGLDARAWQRQQGWTHWPPAALALSDLHWSEHNGWVIASAQLEQLSSSVLRGVQEYHARHPDELGPESQRCRRLYASRLPTPLWSLLVQRLEQSGTLICTRGFLHLPQHGARMRAAEQVVAERVLPLLAQGGFDPPWVRTLAQDCNLVEAQLRDVLARLATSGMVYAVVKDLYYHPQAIRELATLVRRAVAEHGSVEAAQFRDATGLGRKRAIQILEFFDRIGMLRRVGDTHLLRPGTTLFTDAER